MRIFLTAFFVISTSAYAETPNWGEKLAQDFIKLSIKCTEQEYPNTYDRIIGLKKKPKQIHPSFYGCYDWHSAVHGHWAMLRVIRAFPRLAERSAIEKIFNKHFRSEHIAGEIASFKERPGFELPYGHAWFFRLLQELDASKLSGATKWRRALMPLEKYLQRDLMAYLKKINRPERTGMHWNTAFAFTHTYDYAVSTKNFVLAEAIRAKSKEFFQKDANCPIEYEPSNSDFVSPCFVEADLMRRILPPKEFIVWLDAFLPEKKLLEKKEFLRPIDPLDSKDPLLGHLIGLMFQKASSMSAIAGLLPNSDLRKSVLEEAAAKQAARGIELMFGSGYGGEHWLASFAIFHYSKAYLEN